MAISVSAACICHTGLVRHGNEDNFCFDGVCLELPNQGLASPLTLRQPLTEPIFLGVFDGIGGEQCGELASQAAAQAAAHQADGSDLGKLVVQLNEAVVAVARREKVLHMGTTMAALRLLPDSALIASVGDSRVYRLRDDRLCQLSEDHVSTLVKANQLKPPLLQYLGMNPEEVRLEPCCRTEEIQENDLYLLCTDGITDLLSDTELQQLLLDHNDPGEAAAVLQATALDRGGIDNLTAIICRLIPDPAVTFSCTDGSFSKMVARLFHRR